MKMASFSSKILDRKNGTMLNTQRVRSNGQSFGKFPVKDGDVVHLATDNVSEGIVKFSVKIVQS